MSNSRSRASASAAAPSAASLTSKGKRVAPRILRTMLRMVEESSTTRTRLGSRTRIDRERLDDGIRRREQNQEWRLGPGISGGDHLGGRYVGDPTVDEDQI